jgi:hypothetical protein
VVGNHPLRHMIQVTTSKVKFYEVLHPVDMSVRLQGDPYSLVESPVVIDLRPY